MGFLDLLIHNKIKHPIFYNEHQDERLNILNNLINKVGDDQKEVLLNEIKLVQIGLSGEKNVIYELKNSKTPLIFIHDISLENSINDAQIDFIVITKKCIIVLETKKMNGDIKIDEEANFIRYFKNCSGIVYKKEGIYSPITQNKYHVDALRKLLDLNKIARLTPIYSLVVVANEKTIINKKYAPIEVKNRIIKYDQLNTMINKLILESKDALDLTDNKMINIAEIIINNDTKKSIDYVNKFKLRIIEDVQPKVLIIDENNTETYNISDELYEKLKSYRINKANELGIQPYMIFNNDVLAKIVLEKPSNKEEFIAIQGLGEHKFNKYGIDIIKIINPNFHDENHAVSTKDISDISDSILYKKLKNYRIDKARKMNVQLYFIFNNETLDNLVLMKPKTKEELLLVKGFGQKKVEHFGDEILKIFNE